MTKASENAVSRGLLITVEELADTLALTPKEKDVIASRLAGTARGGLRYEHGVSKGTMKERVSKILAKADDRGLASDSLNDLIVDAVRRRMR